MNPRTEQRLKAAFTAKAEQVTEDRLPARRPLPDEGASDNSATAPDPAGSSSVRGADGVQTDPAWRAHWIAPALAAAAVAAVAARAQQPPGLGGRRQSHASSAGQPDEHPGCDPDSGA